jgi:hypothetical protein
MADGLRPALLRCSSFRYFHSPCRVLCTFRSPYLCNIGHQPCRGILSETPQGSSGCTFKQPYTGGGSKPQGEPHRAFQEERYASTPGFHLRSTSREALPSSCSIAPRLSRRERESLVLGNPPRLVHPSPAWSARGSRPQPQQPQRSSPSRRGLPAGVPGWKTRPAKGVAPFGSHVSLAVTERDTVVFSSSAKGYA